ncbi:ABC transporter ATP-binding protein [Candidatus Formimonas warabiya]|uniref:Macrolide ABC transporter ATP-binding protein n=1 Tax=Formimonas warabiya TaxID=1761012 RepID=A0A3G1KPN3_FORW1|nr:ABC transporter ATP-binding protein [Candidatus Formimonas warabiya]ATW24390.1 macrolide ABC transporter ATP-binding protein [Candidatus Formimonas warabiya]
MIDIRNVTKTYDTGAIQCQALRGVSLNIHIGEYVAIMGPSGSGKSTLMNILGCLDTPSTGEFYFEGQEISKYSEDQLAEIRNQKIGFVFQQFNLLAKINAIENVELPLIYRGISSKQRRDLALQALEQVGLSDRITHKPSELSGGQQQRVAIARALAGNPPMILADEPTGALDSKSGGEVLEILKRLHQSGRTIILITHDINVARQAERIIVIRDGLIEEEGEKVS